MPQVSTLFISHSSQDTKLAELLINLLRSALNLSATAIRCTSVDGYRLPSGVNTSEQLRSEVHDTKALIGVVSPASLNSMYVAFELGARWGANKPLFPILVPGVDPSVMSSPLTEINALRCDSAAQLHQLIADLAKLLDAEVESAAVFQAQIDQILDYKPSYPDSHEPSTTKLFNEVRVDAAKQLLKFLSEVLNREAPDKLKHKYDTLRFEWADLNRTLYLLQAPESLREEFDDRMVKYLKSLNEFANDPTERPEVERQRDLAKRQARQLLLRLGLAAEW